MQTSYNLEMGEAYAGMKADSRFDTVESKQALGAIPFGYPVGAEAGNVNQVSTFAKDNCSLLYDADFVASNSIAVTVNGVAITPVVFLTDQATTLALLIAAINALPGVTAIAGGARTVLIEMDSGVAITVSTVVTGGVSQATGTPTYTSDNLFRGIALHIHKAPVNGLARYENTESVSVLRQGVAWSEVSVAVTADQDAYVDIAAATAKFTNVSSGNLATGGKFRSTTAGAGIAKVEINLP